MRSKTLQQGTYRLAFRLRGEGMAFRDIQTMLSLRSPSDARNFVARGRRLERETVACPSIQIKRRVPAAKPAPKLRRTSAPRPVRLGKWQLIAARAVQKMTHSGHQGPLEPSKTSQNPRLCEVKRG